MSRGEARCVSGAQADFVAAPVRLCARRIENIYSPRRGPFPLGGGVIPRAGTLGFRQVGLFSRPCPCLLNPFDAADDLTRLVLCGLPATTQT